MMIPIRKIAFAAILGLCVDAKALGEEDAKFRALSTHSSGRVPMGL